MTKNKQTRNIIKWTIDGTAATSGRNQGAFA